MVPGRCDGTERLDPPLLGGKLQIPRPGFPLLPRQRIHALLDRATRHRVTLVSGPPGAGKTVACASWAGLRPAGQVIWLTMDPADRRDWFWAYVCASVSRARPAPPAVLHCLEDTGPGVLGGLDVLIRHAPPTLRLVLAARRPPALQLARPRVCGELGEIGAADLACTAEEAEAYFAMLGIRLPAAGRDQILRRTEGWMAGIRLAALQAKQDARSAVAAADGHGAGAAGDGVPLGRGARPAGAAHQGLSGQDLGRRGTIGRPRRRDLRTGRRRGHAGPAEQGELPGGRAGRGG
jgi:ATP/maltotriose-dependent transcriptional regulator MalT